MFSSLEFSSSFFFCKNLNLNNKIMRRRFKKKKSFTCFVPSLFLSLIIWIPFKFPLSSLILNRNRDNPLVPWNLLNFERNFQFFLKFYSTIPQPHFPVYRQFEPESERRQHRLQKRTICNRINDTENIFSNFWEKQSDPWEKIRNLTKLSFSCTA